MVSMNERSTDRRHASARSVRSIVLGWTDRESGEDVVIDVRGAPGLLEGIESQGFVILRDSSAGLKSSDAQPASSGLARIREMHVAAAERLEPGSVECVEMEVAAGEPIGADFDRHDCERAHPTTVEPNVAELNAGHRAAGDRAAGDLAAGDLDGAEIDSAAFDGVELSGARRVVQAAAVKTVSGG